MILRRLALILFLFVAVFASAAAETNYFCIICGKGPLTGRIWMSKWGAICDDCYKLENHCSICGLPIGKDFIKTGDGRFICKFDKTNAVLEVAEAREVFAATRRDLIGLLGRGFALNFPDVTVNLFDVDYWSEQGHADGLHKFGFASTRKTPAGDCTHEVVLLSGRLRNELVATAAHEYTHLWMNENRPADHAISADTVEAICELVAYKLMASEKLPEQQKRILENPYTHGEITNLVTVDKQHGFAYVLNWVKNGTTTSFAAVAAPVVASVKPAKNAPALLPTQLKFSGLSVIGTNQLAIISGADFAPGDQRRIKLRDKTVLVRCREIHTDEVILEIDGSPDLVKLKMGGAN